MKAPLANTLLRENARYLCGHVVTSSVSLISVQARKITHFTASSFPKKSSDFSGTRFPVQQHSKRLSYPPKRKSYIFSTSILDLISLDFCINKIAATRHHEWQEYLLLLKFAMLCNGFEIQNHAAIRQPKRAAYVRRRSALSIGWHSILTFMCLFNFQDYFLRFLNFSFAYP